MINETSSKICIQELADVSLVDFSSSLFYKALTFTSLFFCFFAWEPK